MYYFIFPIDMKIYKGSILQAIKYRQVFQSPFNIVMTFLYQNRENTNFENLNINRFILEYYNNIHDGECSLLPSTIQSYIFSNQSGYVVPYLIISENKEELQKKLNIAYEIFYLTKDRFYNPYEHYNIHGSFWNDIQDRAMKYIINKLFR